MLINHLFEDAESDASRSVLADRVFQSAVKHLYALQRAGEQLPTAIYGGKNLPCLPAEDFDPPAMFKDCVFIFQPNDYAMGGKAAKLAKKIGGRYQYLVIIEVEGASVDEIIKSLRYDRVETVVRHELQHIVDYKRYKGDIFKSREPNFKTDNKMSDEFRKGYHNSSAETNAYFHNLAEPLLKRIRFMKQHGAEMAEIFPPLPRDFPSYLKEHLRNNNYGVLKLHWENLTEANKRKALARLSKLFSLYWQIIDTAAKSTPPEMTP